jgi:hypothetical protein
MDKGYSILLLMHLGHLKLYPKGILPSWTYMFEYGLDLGALFFTLKQLLKGPLISLNINHNFRIQNYIKLKMYRYAAKFSWF